MLNVRNYYEQLVTDRLWKLVENSAEPLSQTFIDDVACLTLNQLPPCYVRNTIDKGIHVNEQQFQAMSEAVDKAVAVALRQALNHPHEDRKDA